MVDYDTITAIQRIAFAMIIGGVIGIDREVKKRTAGFKTYSMVCVGAALVMLTSEYIHTYCGQTGDISRLGAQVISGVGFLGVGTIVASKNQKVSGLTTAAGLWVCACIGLAIGIGYISGAVIAGVAVLVLLKLLKYIDDGVKRRSHFVDIYIELIDAKAINHVIQMMNELPKVEIVYLRTVSSKVKGNQIGINVTLKLKKNLNKKIALYQIEEIDAVALVHEIYT